MKSKNIHMKRKGTVRVFAPGKLMLLGEHAVVYGYPCLSVALNKGVIVQAEGSKRDWIASQISDHRFVLSAKEVFFRNVKKKSPIRLTIQSNISGLGLGSSSAVTVATIFALFTFYGISASPKSIFTLSLEAVKKIQPKASGYDVATSIYGGIIVFHGKTKRVQKLGISDIPLLIGFSGAKADTAMMVEKVSVMRKKDPPKANRIFQDIGDVVLEGKDAILGKEWSRMGKIMNENQQLLSSLGVSTLSLDRMISASSEAGALGAKLSGAGGGDCMIALYKDSSKKDIEKALEKSGATLLPLRVSKEGVRAV